MFVLNCKVYLWNWMLLQQTPYYLWRLLGCVRDPIPHLKRLLWRRPLMRHSSQNRLPASDYDKPCVQHDNFLLRAVFQQSDHTGLRYTLWLYEHHRNIRIFVHTYRCSDHKFRILVFWETLL